MLFVKEPFDCASFRLLALCVLMVASCESTDPGATACAYFWLTLLPSTWSCRFWTFACESAPLSRLAPKWFYLAAPRDIMFFC